MSEDGNDNWYIFVGEQVYGPFTSEVMLGFVDEGRVISTSLMSREANKGFLPASQFTEFTSWKSGNAAKPLTSTKKTQEDVSSKHHTYIVMGEIDGRSSINFLRTLQGFGDVQRIGDSVWALCSNHNLEQIHTALAPTLDRRDRLFIQDCENNKQVWVNLGTDLDGRLKKIWS